MQPLLERVENGQLNPARVITHRLPLTDAPRGYKIVKNKKDNCEKVILHPEPGTRSPQPSRPPATHCSN
jgi:threonine dehydrogenase-like Zn-dependent dehydrogenase